MMRPNVKKNVKAWEKYEIEDLNSYFDGYVMITDNKRYKEIYKRKGIVPMMEGDFGSGYTSKTSSSDNGRSSEYDADHTADRVKAMINESEIEKLDKGRNIVSLGKSRDTDGLMTTKLTEEDEEFVNQLTNAIDETDQTSVMNFGTNAQKKISAVSDRLIQGVKTRDLSVVRDDLQSLVATAQGYEEGGESDGKGLVGFFNKHVMRKTVDPLRSFVNSYDTVEKQIDSVQSRLLDHRVTLLESSKNLQDMYQSTMLLYKELQLHIVAIERKIEEVQEGIDDYAEGMNKEEIDPGEAHYLDTLKRQRNSLERQHEALKQTQTLALQDIPAIMSMKDVDIQLMNKVQQATNHMIPLWKKKLAMIVEASKTQDAITAMDAVGDFTDSLVVESASKIRAMTKKGIDHIDRALASTEAIAAANKEMISMVDEVVDLTEHHRELRQKATLQLTHMQRDLGESVSNARDRSTSYELTHSSKRAAIADQSKTAAEKVEETMINEEEDKKAAETT